MLEKFKRIKLGHFPTPIEHLKNISKHLDGPNIFIKRDDCTGLATGGNKTRKLEFLMPDALKNKAELVVTIGAVQSNHARQTAAACTLLNLKCLIILEQRLNDPPEAYMNSGNVFLDKLFAIKINLQNLAVSSIIRLSAVCASDVISSASSRIIILNGIFVSNPANLENFFTRSLTMLIPLSSDAFSSRV